MINGSVIENLALPLTLQQKQLPERKAKELLQLVKLKPHKLSQHIRDLSSGELQRLTQVRTLKNKPSILLLDEITASLDPHSTNEIERLILSINQSETTTIVWITHDLEQARKVADYAWIVINGQLYESEPITVLQQPQNKLARQFVRNDYK